MAHPGPGAVLINLDVPDLDAACAFYAGAFGLRPGRRLEAGFVELLGAPAPIYLLLEPAGSVGAGAQVRSYERHWCPIHLDFAVADLDQALTRALQHGARLERAPRRVPYGRIAGIADPFGHGICLIQFEGRGYDELLQPSGG